MGDSWVNLDSKSTHWGLQVACTGDSWGNLNSRGTHCQIQVILDVWAGNLHSLLRNSKIRGETMKNRLEGSPLFLPILQNELVSQESVTNEYY